MTNADVAQQKRYLFDETMIRCSGGGDLEESV